MNDRVVRNPNFKNNGEFHASLKARGVGAKDWPNSHTEVGHLGNGKFAASIGVGHKVFFDKADGNKPKKHKLSDERATKDYVLIQGARCCTEVYPYYAKYFDVQHEEVRVEEERWVVQRLFKEPDEWRDVDAYNPQMAVEEYSEPAGDIVKVTVTYDTDYGTLTVEYFQRDGNALKHNVTFKNTSGSTETFRVLQKWAGIVADRVNEGEITAPKKELKYAFRFEKEGKVCIRESLGTFIPTWQEELEAAKKNWIRHGECNQCGKCCPPGCPHYSAELPGCTVHESLTPEGICWNLPWSPEQIQDIPECSYSFEATGVNAYPTKLQSTALDAHPQGMKADFSYGNWVLAQDESLEIDPDTATLDNPTEDGYIRYSVGYDRWNAAEDVRFFYDSGLSLLAGTNILMHDNKVKLIEDVKVGNKVVSFDPYKNTSSISEVLSLRSRTVFEHFVINGTLKLTPNHLVWSSGSSKFVEVRELEVGDYLLDRYGQDLQIESIERISAEVVVYSLEATSPHTYFADGLLVHNAKWWWRGYVEWDHSGIGVGMTITKIEFRYHGTLNPATDNCYIYAMANQPSAQADDDAGNHVIWDDAGDGVAYLDNDAVFPEVGATKDVGGASGPAWDTDPKGDVETNLAVGWFALGFKTSEATGTNQGAFYSENKTDAPTPKPTLYVEYEEAAVGLENKSANMGSKMVAAGLI